MASEGQVFNLDMNAEVAANQANPKAALDLGTTEEIAARVQQVARETAREAGIDEEMNPIAFEKIQRDLAYQKQIEMLKQPDAAPQLAPQTTPELDRIEALQKELDTAKSEASRWKKEFGRREGKVGGMEQRIKDLEARLGQMQPAISVQQITGRDPNEAITAQDAVNLLMSQSQAFGNAIQKLRDELLSASTPQNDGLPLDMEAELVEAHPWLTDLPRPQKMRAMHDILSQSGVSITSQQQNQPSAATHPPTLPESARAQVRQAAYIEPSNKSSVREQSGISQERQALNAKLNRLNELKGKPGGSAEMSEILASLGAGTDQDSQYGLLAHRR